MSERLGLSPFVRPLRLVALGNVWT
jgi:hypothetical protein